MNNFLEPTEVYPLGDETQWHKPLWCVYGHTAWPQVFCCKITNADRFGPTIWGYSVYRRKPGFRTLGKNLAEWIHQEELQDGHEIKFYDSLPLALERLRLLLTPRVEL
jgi:hypothetical protein